jgi:Domain of unknown function (DUF5615)
MRVLLDECVDRRVLRHLTGHQVTTVSKCGWAGIKNGHLLALAEKEFDVFVTMDRNLSFQQSLPKFGIALVVLRARSNRLSDLLPLVPEIINAISSAKPGVAFVVGG